MKGGVLTVLLNNRRGSVLTMVMAVTVVLTILGVSLSSLAITDQRQAIRQQKNNEAYYLALSGAEVVATQIVEDPDSAPGILAQGVGTIEFPNGQAEVNVTAGEAGSIIIDSLGQVGKYADRVTLSLIPRKVGYKPIFDMGLFADGTITTGGTFRIYGSMGSNITDNNGIIFGSDCTVSGNCYVGPGSTPETVVQKPSWKNWKQVVGGELNNLPAKVVYPSVKYPEPPSKESLGIKPNINAVRNKVTVSQPGYYDNIVVGEPLSGQPSIIFNVGNGDLKVRVKEFQFTTANPVLKIQGSGRLLLYVDEYFGSLNDLTIGSVKVNLEGDSNQFCIYYAGNQNIDVGGNAKIHANLFSSSPTAKLNLGAGGSFVGSIFANGPQVTVGGGGSASADDTSVIYAPNAEVKLSGGINLKGAVICKSFSSSGNNTIEFRDEVNDLIPGDIEFDIIGDDTESGFRRGYWFK